MKLNWRKNLVLVAIGISLITMTGAATGAGDQMFRIEFTVYEDHNFTYLHVDTVEGSKYLPFGENPQNEVYDFELYNFRFYDENGNLLDIEEVYIHFPRSQPLAEPGQPSMTSKHMQIPIIEEAEQLQIMYGGRELETVDLVDRICEREPDGACDQFCGSHGVDPDCQPQNGTDPGQTDGSDSSNAELTDLLMPGLILVGAIILILGAYFLYFKPKKKDDQGIQYQR